MLAVKGGRKDKQKPSSRDMKGKEIKAINWA